MATTNTPGRVQTSYWRQALAWGVHLYTGLGLVAAAGMAILIFRGDAEAFRWTFLLMLAATVIDATDGTLARAVRIQEVLPHFDGRRLDDLVDFLTYTVLPLFLIWRARILPAALEVWLLVPLLASAYGFCQISAKTEDGFFLGFPSYWNLVAFYLYTLQVYFGPLPSWFSLGTILGLSVLTFVPSRYLYPSQRGRLNRLTTILGAGWGGLCVVIITRLGVAGAEESSRWLILLSLFFPAYYLVASWAVSWRLWRHRRRQRRNAAEPVGQSDDA